MASNGSPVAGNGVLDSEGGAVLGNGVLESGNMSGHVVQSPEANEDPPPAERSPPGEVASSRVCPDPFPMPGARLLETDFAASMNLVLHSLQRLEEKVDTLNRRPSGRVAQPQQAFAVPEFLSAPPATGGGFKIKKEDPAKPDPQPAERNSEDRDIISSRGSGALAHPQERESLMSYVSARITTKVEEISTVLGENYNKVYAKYHKRRTEKVNRDMVSPFTRTTRNIVSSTRFDGIVMGLIALNAISIGAEVQCDATGIDLPSIFFVAEVTFMVLFTLELLCRITAYGRKTWEYMGPGWFLFDVVLVLMAVTDFLVSCSMGGPVDNRREVGVLPGATDLGRMLRVLRMTRALRVLRIFRFLKELRVMMQMIGSSVLALVSMMLFLGIEVFLFSLILTDSMTSWRITHSSFEGAPGEEGAVYQNAEDYYGSVQASMYTLFRSITSGVNWTDPCDILLKTAGFPYFFLFIFFIAATLFFLLNLITGIMVDGAVELVKHDRNILIDKEMKARDSAAEHLVTLLTAVDVDGNGVIDRPEFVAALEDPAICCFMEALEIDTSTALSMFDLMDSDASGTVDIAEWVEGMRRMKGSAKSADIQFFRQEMSKSLLVMYSRLEATMCFGFRTLGVDIPTATMGTQRLSASKRGSMENFGGVSGNKRGSLDTWSLALDGSMAPKRKTANRRTAAKASATDTSSAGDTEL